MRRDEIAEAAGVSIDTLLAYKRELDLPSLPRGHRGPRGLEYTPSPSEIATGCAQIRQGWSIAEHAIRQGFAPLGDVETEAARKHRIVSIRSIAASWEP